jgi:thiamine-monophosphate kinase
MNVSNIGEFGLIKKLAKLSIDAVDNRWLSSRQLVVGIGDDAAFWKADNPFQMATVDSLVQDVHFSLKTTTWEELGWKSIAVNLSDIAAMGGVPLYALISLGLPGSMRVADVTALYDGMVKISKKFHVAIVGGDTVSSPFVFVSTRAGAVPGDKIAVTGYLGASAGGLKMLSENIKFSPGSTAKLRNAHLKPDPRVIEGQAMVANGVKAGMDISDGLVGDLTHICEMSRIGARLNIDMVPVSPATQECFEGKALEMALSGGEDYELLFTAPESVIKKVKESLACPVTVIGEITATNKGKVLLINEAGKQIDLKKKGWDHFVS